MTILRDRTFAELALDTQALQQLRARAGQQFLVAAREALRETARSGEKDLETATEAAGLGRLAKAWNSQVFPKSGVAEAPSATIYPKGKTRTLGAILAYSKGARIRSKTAGQMLAIPLRAAGPRYYGRGKVAVTPREWERRTGLLLSPAKIGGRLYLVTNGIVGKKTGRIAVKATANRIAQGRAVKRLLIFLLLDQVDVAKRFDIAAATRGLGDLLERNFAIKVNAIVASLNGAGG